MEKVTINKIERLKTIDSKGLTSRDIKRKFGKSNDYVELHIHDLGGELLETTPNYQGYSLPDQVESNTSQLTSTLFIDPYKHLEDKGYTVGVYNVACNVQRKKVFSGLQADFKIHEISPSRTELKIKGLGVSEDKVKKAILDFIGEIEESLFNKDFILNFGNNINILGINVAYHNVDGVALIKLYEPLPSDLEKGAEFWVVEEIIEPLEFKVDLGEIPLKEGGIPLRGPNFRIDTRLNDSIPSQFKVYNDFLENTNSASLYNVLSHLSESVELSIDYTKTGTGSLETGYHFENFTHFGSAEERLKNFKYKLELLELYQRQIDEINTIQGSVSSSAAVTTNISLIETKKAKLISGLDNYEKFLYYENHPYAWPKTPDFGIGNLQITGSALLDESYWLQVGLTDCDVFFKPYNLRPTTSSQAVEWYGSTTELNIDYGGQILSASRFDRDNRHGLVRTIPEHISMRDENAQYLTFTNMIGHYFDQIWLYIDHIGQIRNAHNSSKDGISKDLVFTALSSLGVEAFDQFENEELFEYIIGTNKAKSGSFGTYDAPEGTTMITSSLVTCDNGGGSMPKGDITKEIWKRLYHNLPYLLKTKGTERGIKALMNCYGVPETILNVKEYGGPTTDSTTYKTFNYEKFSRALAGSSDTEGYFIKAPWASTSSLFNGTIESKPNRSEGKIIFSIGAVKDLFNAPFPKTVELTATDLSVHTFTSNYDFVLHGESGLETAQSLTGAIDAHPLFSASVFVREDLYSLAHEKYNLDIEIMITQHLQGIDGNTEIKGTLFEDTLTPACGNPQQFPEVEFLTKIDFNEGGGINNSTSNTTVIPGINTCSSKVLIQNGIAADGSGNLINNGLFQDDAEYMDFVTNIANGYINIDISLFSFESLTPSAIPLYLGESQCMGTNDYGLFVIECFKADNCVDFQSVSTEVSPGTPAVATITLPNLLEGDNSILQDKTIILTSADGNIHTFILIGGDSINAIGLDLMNQIDLHPDFDAVEISAGRLEYQLEIITVATGSSANNPIQGSALSLPGEQSSSSLIAIGFLGGTNLTGGESESTDSCNAILNFYVTDEGSTSLNFDITTTQYVNYLVQGSTGDLTYDSYLFQALPYAQGEFVYDVSAGYIPTDGDFYNYGLLNDDYVFSNDTNQVFVTSTSIIPDDKITSYLAPTEILNYLNSDCGNVSSTSDACYANYTTFINALNDQGIINTGIPGVNVDTKWSELKASDIVTHFPASSSCGCNNWDVTNVETQTTTTQLPTTNTSIPLGQGAQSIDYGGSGTRFFSDTNLGVGNNYTIDTPGGLFGKNQGNLNNGRLNNIGVWDGTVPYTGDDSVVMTPLDQWIGFSECINVPADGEYLIGMACANSFRLTIDNELLVNRDTLDSTNWNFWWVYKVNLTAGQHVINIEGYNFNFNSNINGLASLGCDIAGPFPTGTFNSNSDFQDIDTNGATINGISYIDLEDVYSNNIIFSSEDELNGSAISSDTCDDATLIQSSTAANTLYGLLNSLTINQFYFTGSPIKFKRKKHPALPDYLIPWEDAPLDVCLEGGNLDPLWKLTAFEIRDNLGDVLHTESMTNPEAWKDLITALDTFTSCHTSQSWYASTVIQWSNIHSFFANNGQACNGIQIYPVGEWCRCGTASSGGEFNTQTNLCSEGYSYNECTGFCEKIEIEITEEVDECSGLIVNSDGCLNKIDTDAGGLSFTSQIYKIAVTPDFHNAEFNSLKWALGGGNQQPIPLPAACVQDDNITHFAYIKYVTYSGLGNVQYTTWASFIDAINLLGYSFQYGNLPDETNFGWQDLQDELGESELVCVWDWCDCGDNGSFATSADFVDHFTDFNNGYYGQNIDDYYFESDEPLPWGTFVADQCTGSNGLPIRRVIGFKKDPSILPLDNTLYVNYQTFINQLNADEHGVSETESFSNLASTLITGSFEGSCQHKTLITNPETNDGSFPTPGSGNTGMVDFLEYYSEQTNNIQDIAVDSLKFAVDPDSLSTTFQALCPIDATIYCFYDGTSINEAAALNIMTTVENWVGEQGVNFTGNVYHMVSSHERWLDVARLPFTNIGDHLQNGGIGSISTIYSSNDTISDAQPQTNNSSNSTTGHTWYKVPLDGTSNTRAKEIKNMLWNDGNTIVVNGITVNLKDVINDGNGLYDDDFPNTNSGLSGAGHTWRGPAPSLVNATDKALCFNFYDESGQHGGSGQQDKQYHSFSDNTTPTFTDINCSKAKIEGTKQGKIHYRSDYELYIKTYLDTVDRNASEYKDQGDLIHVMYPSAPIGLTAGNNKGLGADGSTYFGYTQLAFPLHVLGTILTGSAGENPGMLEPSHEILQPGASIAINFDALNGNAQTNSNAYCNSVWANTAGEGTPSGYDPTYGYGGLQKYGWNLTPESIKENPFTSIEFESTVNNIVESVLCVDYTEVVSTDPNICLDNNGNMLFTIDEFFMDPGISATSFLKYTDYITEGYGLGYGITLGDTRLESQIGGPIAVDECICADVCPNNLVLNNNTTITITGSIFDQYSHPFTPGDSIQQANNTGFTATVSSIDDVSNSLIIEITSGTLTFTDQLISISSGNQYVPDPSIGEFIIPQPQGVFTNYDEYMEFVSTTTNGFSSTDLNTLKFQLVDQSFTSTEVTTEESDCSISADIFVFYDNTSMGEDATDDAFNAVNDYIQDLAQNQGFNKNVYHFLENDEKYLKWARKVLQQANSSTALNSLFYHAFPWENSVSNGDMIGDALATNGTPVYFGPDQVNASGYVSTANPTSIDGDILVICFIDESSPTSNRYVPNSPAYVDEDNPTTQELLERCTPIWQNTDGSPFTAPTSTWITDHNEYTTEYNNYTGGNVACFIYPTARYDEPGIAGRAVTPSVLHYLAAITSGDNNNGLLSNVPYCGNGELNGGGDCPNGTDLSILNTENPYFTTGYGALDQMGWGYNVSFPDLSNNGSQIISEDLNNFVLSSNICSETTETITDIEVDILCTGSTSTDTNQYGLYTVEGFYQNSLIEPTTTINEYSADTIFYGSWNSFISQKIQESGATGIDFQNNNGASINTNTSWEDLSNSVQTSENATETEIITVPGDDVNVFDNSLFNNSGLNSNINGSPTQQLDWLIGNGDPTDLDSYYFINNLIDETLSPYNNCTGTNLPANGGVYSTLDSFDFTIQGGLTFSSTQGNYTSWNTFIDTVNSLNFITGQGTDVTAFNGGSVCETATDTGISGSAYTSSLTYQVIYESTNFTTGATIEEAYIDYVAQNYGTGNFNEHYFEDTGYNAGTCLSYLKYGTSLTLNASNVSSDPVAAAFGFFGPIMQSGQLNSVGYTTWNSFIDDLNHANNLNNKGDDPFQYTDSLASVISQIIAKQDKVLNNSFEYSYEGEVPKYDIELNVESCECSTTTTPGAQIQTDIFTYTSNTSDVLNYFNNVLEGYDTSSFTVNSIEASCTDIPGEPIEVEGTQSIAGNIPLYGQIDGGACVCIPETTGGESLDGDIEFESCICCPESSSISVGCLVAGEVSSSRCECSADTFETIINFVSASSFDIIPSSSAKMVEFRIKPHRLDKPEYTSLEACCDPIKTIPTASHLFSLYNEHHPEVTPHLILRPYTGSDVSSSDDYRDFGSLDLYKKGIVVGSTDIFPVYNGAFWNVFIGTKGESGSNSEVSFGAYQSNFLGHVTHLTASATFSEYERALSFGDTAYNLINSISPAETAYFCGVPTNTNSISGSINTFKYSGSLQEIKYHIKDFLTHDTLTKHALDPFQYAGNTVSSSWNNVYLRLPLGSNNKVDSASYNNNGLGIIQNFNPHPSFSLYESSSISSSVTNQVFGEVYETHRHLTPDTVGISTTSEKVRIDSGSVDRSILSFDIKSETSTLDRQALDYNDLGVFFSPQAEINEDIVYTLGAFRMDDYIGDPTHQSLAEYPDLEELKLTYFQKYLNSYRQNMFDYIKLIQYIDHTLFKVIEQFVPAKANLKTGLLIEPHYLERQKFARQIPTFERLERDVEFDPYLNLEGEVKHYEACINISDLNNENYYVWEGAQTASDNLHMSQSKHASDECNPYITLYDNFDPLYGNYVDCIISKEYYFVSKPPTFHQNDPVREGIDPRITINPVQPSKPTGVAGKSLAQIRSSAFTTSSSGGSYGA